jgi:hypothetical protein
MSKNFKPGLKYVFSYKKYKAYCRKRHWKLDRWGKVCNGQVVLIKYIFAGTTANGYSVSPEQCKCISRVGATN